MRCARYAFTSFKYPRTPHRAFEAYGLVREGDCRIFWREDATMTYPGTGRRRFFHEAALEFVWPDRGYKMALWYRDDGAFGGLYADVCLPPAVDEERRTVQFLDLDLDLQILGEGGAQEVLDRDEFLENRRRLRYPATLSAFAEGALERVQADVRRGRFPLDRPFADWYALLDDLCAACRNGATGGES